MSADATMRGIERRVAAHAGFQLPAWVLVARVRDRMVALGLEQVRDYLARLESAGGEAELDALAERLRVGETRFFRHDAHVSALRRVVAPDLTARRMAERRVRVWSAGCATGEEAYTLAIVLRDALPSGWDVEVLATDLSDEALAVARAGEYVMTALAPVPRELREQCFVAGERAGWAQVAPAVAACVRFDRLNLVTDRASFPRRMDVILCRNVLIYFDAASRARTIEELIESLAPGGYLFLGYAESLRQFAQLEALRTSDGVVYRRPLGEGKRRAAAVAVAVVPAASASASAIGAGSKPAVAVRARVATVQVRLKGAYDDAAMVAKVLVRAIGDAGERVELDLDGADYLADDVAIVLRRATAAAEHAGMAFVIHATRPGPRRWLSRHGFEAST